MRFFLDTEFYENGRTIELISIGICAEDGRDYYAETPGAWRLAQESRWLHENVLGYLKGGDAIKGRYQIANEIVEFVGPNPEFWAWYGSYDWVVLCQLYGAMIDLPRTWPMYIRDFKQVVDNIGYKPPPIDTGVFEEHNALSDASWLRGEYIRFFTSGPGYLG